MKDRVSTLEKQDAALQKQNTELTSTCEQILKDHETIELHLYKEVQKGRLKVKQYKNMMSVNMSEQLFFDSGSATLQKEVMDILKDVAEGFKETSRQGFAL